MESKYKVPSFIKRDGESLVFNREGSEFIFYVPDVYFERGDAEIVGEFVVMLGVMDYTIIDSKGKNNGLHKFYFPTIFLTMPYTIEKIKNIKLTPNSEPGDYRMLKYKVGDKIVFSVNVPRDIDNVESFYNLITCGKLPTTVRYDEMQNYFIDNMKLNGSSYGVSMQLFGIFISEMCRSKSDPSKAFRLSKSDDMTNYSTINLRDIPKYIDPYASITSENWSNSLISSINMDNSGKSPMERLLMEQANEG